MTRDAWRYFDYLAALALANLRQGFARPGQALSAAAMMFANNLIFFLVWVFYFARFKDLRGWTLPDLALLYGVGAWGFGLLVALAAGVRDISRVILDGSLDVHLGRPRHPLPSLLLSRSIPAGFGDMASAIVLWAWLGGRGIGDMVFAALLATAAAGVIGASLVVAHSLAFWWPRAARLGEELLNALIMISVYPQHVYGFVVRLALFTILPVAFIALMPVEAVRDGDPLKALAVLAAAIGYSALASVVFDRGLRQYRSGNLFAHNR